MIRLHNNQVEVLGGTFNKTTNEFTFQTDKFSTYGIVYKDTRNSSGGSGSRYNTKEKTYQTKQLKVIKDGSITSYKQIGLKSGIYYKYYVKAYKLSGVKRVWLTKSKMVHSVTKGGKYGNAESIKVNKSAVSLKVGKSFAIKAEEIAEGLPIKKHEEIQFESSNSRIAAVTGKGVIKAKKKGTCYIYVYAQNGRYKRIKVTVK